MNENKGVEAQLDRINDNIGISGVIVTIAILLAGGTIGSGMAAGVCFALAILLFFFFLKAVSEEKQKSVGPESPKQYRHYKGGVYELVCEATMEADRTSLIVYRAADGSIWSRPRDVFFEQIEVDGKPVQRFVEI